MTALTPERRERLWRKATCETRYLIGDHTAALVSQADLCDLLTAADEADRLREDYKKLDNAACLQIVQANALRAERDRMRAALREYGKHLIGCTHAPMYPECICGLDAALAGGES